jgi:hypothetical protein
VTEPTPPPDLPTPWVEYDTEDEQAAIGRLEAKFDAEKAKMPEGTEHRPPHFPETMVLISAIANLETLRDRDPLLPDVRRQLLDYALKIDEYIRRAN